MREIKFKAWHPSVQKMFEWKLVNRPSGYRWVFVTEGETNISEWDNPKLIKLQFTGLKDKNGKEIYEGDILKGTFPKRVYKNFNNGVVIWAKVRCAFVVEINGTYKNYNDLTSCDADGTVNEETMTDYYMEVIGNIYENESLLKITA